MARMFGFVVRVLIASFAFVGSALADGLLPLDKFTRLDELHAMKISPDGKYLALTTGLNGADYLRFFNLSDGKIETSVQAPDPFVIGDFDWASDTRVIFTLFERATGTAGQMPAGELYAIDRDGRRQIRVSTYQPGRSTTTGTILPVREASYASVEVVSLLRAEDRSILISELPWRSTGTYFSYDPKARPWVTRLDIESGTQVRIEQVPLSSASIIVDGEDRPRFAIGRSDAEQVRVAWKRSADAQWEVFELPGFRDDTVRPRRFTSDDRNVLFTAVPNGARYSALFELDPASRSVKKLIDVANANVAELLVDAASGETIGIMADAQMPTYEWLLPDHPLAQLHQSPPRELAGKNLRLINQSANGHRAIVLAQTDTGSREYFLFDTRTRRVETLAQGWLRPEIFARPDEFGTMKISPDGEYLAITTRLEGGELLSFLKLGESKPTEILRTSDGLFIHDFFWASATRAVFTTAEDDLGKIRARRNGEMFAVDRDGRKFTKIYGSKEEIGEKRTALQIPLANDAAADIVSLLDREADNILIARMPRRAHWLHRTYDPDGKPWLVRLNIHTGERDTVGQAPLASATVIVDHEDQPRFAIGVNDTSKLSVAWKRAADAEWEAFELPGYREGTVRPRCFTADNRSVLFTAIREGERYAALFQLELADRSVKQLIDVPGADVLELVNDPMTKETIGVVGYTDKLIYRWMTSDHPTARALQAMLRAFEGSEVSLVSHSADGRRSIVFVQSDVAPGEYFLFDAQAKKADMIAPARRWIDSQAMRPKEPVSIKARDGLLLQGYVTRPAGSAPYPLVVLPHSGPHHVRDMWGFDPQVQLLANRGYAVLQVNYRGSGGLGVDFEQAGYRQWGAKMQDDVTDATSWAIEQKIAAPERVCIYGVGYGGYAALMGTVREPTLYRCAIGFAGIYDLELMLDSEATAQSQLGSHYFETIIGSDPTELQARSPASQAANITAPVLLIHGEEGLLADDKQAIRMKAALEQAGKHVESLRPFGGKRDVHDAGAQVQVLHALLKFLDRHLMEPDFAAN